MSNEIYLAGDEDKIEHILVLAKEWLGNGINIIDLHPELVKEEDEDD